MASRLGQRLVSLAAGVTIILLVVLIVLLLTMFGNPSGQVDQSKLVAAVRHRGGMSAGNATATDNSSHHHKSIKIPSKAGDLRKIPQNVEYVKPMKISPPPLHEEDLLYGGDEWDWNRSSSPGEPPLHVETGHFRHRTAPLWDPHPQYRFRAFGHLFHLLLVQDSDFVSPVLQVTHLWHNYSSREPNPLFTRGCYYTGTVKGESDSSVAVSLCHGMTGHIRTSTGNYFIEPTESWPDQSKSILHAVYSLPISGIAANNAEEDINRCGLDDERRKLNCESKVIKMEVRI